MNNKELTLSNNTPWISEEPQTYLVSYITGVVLIVASSGPTRTGGIIGVRVDMIVGRPAEGDHLDLATMTDSSVDRIV